MYGTIPLKCKFNYLLLFSGIISYMYPWNLRSRSSKHSSNVSKLDPQNSILDPRKSKLKSRALKLDSRFSKTLRIKNQVSSRDCQLTFEQYCTLYMYVTHSVHVLTIYMYSSCCYICSRFLLFKDVLLRTILNTR